MLECKVYYLNPASPDGITTVLRTTILSKAYDRAKETAKKTGKFVAISVLDFDNCKLTRQFISPDCV